MDQDMVSAAVGPGPLSPEDVRALEAIGDPVLVVARSGGVAHEGALGRLAVEVVGERSSPAAITDVIGAPQLCTAAVAA